MASGLWLSVQKILNFCTAIKKCIPEEKVVTESKANVNVTKKEKNLYLFS